MPRAVSILLRCLGFNRPKPKTALGRGLRWAERGLAVVGSLYIALHLFPQILFPHKVTAGGITIYSREPLPKETVTSLEKAAALLRASEVGDELRREKVFVCGSPGLLRLFNPRGSAVFAVSIPITNNVFIADADFKTDTARRFADQNATRSLSGLIAHEVTHGLLRRRLGLIKATRLPTWVKEGYCEYVAGDGSFPEEEGMTLFLSGEGASSPSYRYFVYRLLARYLLDDRKLALADLVDGSRKQEEVEEEARAHFQRNQAP